MWRCWIWAVGLAGCAAGAGPGPSAPPAPAVTVASEATEAPAGAKAGALPARAKPEVPPPPEAVLAHKWDLKEVRYQDGRPSFAPQRFGGLTLDLHGVAGWSDGCNRHGGGYKLLGEGQVQFFPGGQTLVGCSDELEDVHYEDVTGFKVTGSTLELFTPTQTYVLERFPYSKMSEHDWSLYTITNLRSGDVANVDRFRMDYFHLHLSVEQDATFRFTDLDREEFTGKVRVSGPSAVSLTLDDESRARMKRRGETLGHLVDSTQEYQKTAEVYPTTLAQRLDWDGVVSFVVHEEAIVIMGQEVSSEVLDLETKTHRYRFEPR